MGFLNGTTNNIIIDAVLTDYGRRALSRNDGSFAIIKFALGDDEVDYTLLTQYGRPVGVEKIIKNTPIFEASTSAMYGIRSHLLSSASRTTNIGYLKCTSGTSFAMNILNSKSKDLVFEQQTSDDTRIPSDLTNQVYIVKLDNKFLSIRGRTPRTVSSNNEAQYFINRSELNTNGSNGSILRFTLDIKSNVSSSTFSTYGTTETSGVIRTYVTVIGKESGQSTTIEVEISKS